MRGVFAQAALALATMTAAGPALASFVRAPHEAAPEPENILAAGSAAGPRARAAVVSAPPAEGLLDWMGQALADLARHPEVLAPNPLSPLGFALAFAF